MQDSTLELAKQLISRPSITPEDGGCQDLIAERLKRCGFHTESLLFQNVTNLWATHGKEPPILVFAGHTDVVPPGNEASWGSPPFTPTVREGVLYGRGAADMKGGVAAMVTACEQFVHHNSHHRGTLALLLTSDEEGEAIHGTQAVLDWLHKKGIIIKWCVIGEPTSFKQLGDHLRVGRRGSLTGYLKIIGKQGHVAYPLIAENPIHKAIPALEKLIQIKWDEGDALFPPTHLQISNLHAGTGASNVIPGEIGIDFNLRFSPRLSVLDIQSTITQLLKKEKLNFELTWKPASLPFYSSPGELLKAVQFAIHEKLKIETIASTVGGTSDGRFFVPQGVEVVECGPVNASIHQVNEHVLVLDLERLSELYTHIIQKLLANAE